MIKEITMYTVICDGCGKDSNAGQEFGCWSNRGYAIDCALDSDWKTDQLGRDYCPDCWEYDDNDNLVFTTKQP